LDAGIVGSNPTRGMDVYVYVHLFGLCCPVYVEVLRCADHSPKESYRMCIKDYETDIAEFKARKGL
jgi:hypothetical protein